MSAEVAEAIVLKEKELINNLMSHLHNVPLIVTAFKEHLYNCLLSASEIKRLIDELTKHCDFVQIYDEVRQKQEHPNFASCSPASL